MVKLAHWDPDNQQEWESSGKGTATHNLWISIPNLLCAFSVWLYWLMLAKFMTTILLILPAIGAGIALQNPNVSFLTLIVLAVLSGVGGGAFSSSMSNISFFFPKRVQGLSPGLNAGLGNLGVSVIQFLLPWIITFGAFGSPGGARVTHWDTIVMTGAAIAAYGAFLIPKIVGTQIKGGTPEYALYGFAVYYFSCLIVNWWYYARRNAEIKC